MRNLVVGTITDQTAVDEMRMDTGGNVLILKDLGVS